MKLAPITFDAVHGKYLPLEAVGKAWGEGRIFMKEVKVSSIVGTFYKIQKSFRYNRETFLRFHRFIDYVRER